MKNSLIEDIIRISNQLAKTNDLCDKYKTDCCTSCPLNKLDDCSDFYEIACLEYNNETGKYKYWRINNE